MKKVLLIASLLIFLTPFSSVNAYTGGLLHGKPINYGSDLGVIRGTTLFITDGDVNTTEFFGGVNNARDTFWHEFTNEKTIDSYALYNYGVASMNLKFYDKNKKEIFSILRPGVINTGSRTKITPVPNVKYVLIENLGSSLTVSEWDVFEAPPVNYEEIKKLVSSGITEKEVTITWENPSNNADFKKVKIYRNNQLVREGGITTEKLIDSNLSHSTNFEYKVTAVYADGYETPGIILNVQTLTPPPPPPPIPAILGATIEHNNGYLLKWTAPTSGDIQVIVGGKNYAVVPASNLSYTIPAIDMKYTGVFKDPDVAIYPIDTMGRNTVTVRPQIIGGGNIGQVKAPFNANDLLKVMLGLFGLVAAFTFIALAFKVTPKLTGTIETAANGQTKKRLEQKKGREKREGREGREQLTAKPKRAARTSERAFRPQRAAKVRERATKPKRAARMAKQTTREKERAENGL